MFKTWVVKKYENADTPRGDFARDCRDDLTFPAEESYDTIMHHLILCGACREAEAVFRSLWAEYRREVGRR